MLLRTGLIRGLCENGAYTGLTEKGLRARATRDYHPLVRGILDILLLGAFAVIVPIMFTGALYGLMWIVLCLVRFIPLIGRRHRHSDWERLNT